MLYVEPHVAGAGLANERGQVMAGISGLEEFSKSLRKLSDGVEKLDGLTVNIEPTDSVTTVTEKLRREIRRTGAYEPSASELRGIAQGMVDEARRRQ